MIFTSSSNYVEIRSQVACCHFKILTVNIIVIVVIIIIIIITIPQFDRCAYCPGQEKVMAALTAVLLVSALLSCGVNAHFNVTILCPSSGKKTLMSVSVYILYRY